MVVCTASRREAVSGEREKKTSLTWEQLML
jgi:hypothetical protein